MLSPSSTRLRATRAVEIESEGAGDPGFTLIELRCPDCGTVMAGRGEDYACQECARIFGVTDGVLELLPRHIPDGSLEDIAAWEDPDSGRAEHSSIWRSLLAKEAEIRHLDHLIGERSVGQRILEIGGGMCWASMVFRSNDPAAHIVSTDVSVRALVRAREVAALFGLTSSKYMAVDVHRLPFPDDHFDLVFGSECLHHLADPVRCLREVRRVLAPGGRYLGFGEGAAPQLAIWTMNRLGIRRSLGGAEAEKYAMTEALYTYPRWQSMFAEAGLDAKLACSRDPSLQYQNRARLAYYSLVQLLPYRFVRWALPCSLEIEAYEPI